MIRLKEKIKRKIIIICPLYWYEIRKSAINKLSDKKSKVSCHYFIKKNGSIINLVPDLYISWHAGISFWKKYKKINKYSIGIEIQNPGHQYGYKPFNKKQINSIIYLSLKLAKKYKLKNKNFLDIQILRLALYMILVKNFHGSYYQNIILGYGTL